MLGETAVMETAGVQMAVDVAVEEQGVVELAGVEAGKEHLAEDDRGAILCVKTG